MDFGDAKKWFLTPGDQTGVGPVHTDCFVEAYVDAEEYYAALRKDIEDAANSSSPSDYWLFWIGFECSPDTPLPASKPATDAVKKYSPRSPQSTDLDMIDLLRQADQKGVKLRALLTLHPKPDTDTAKDRYLTHNFTLCQTINRQFKNAFAVNDYRYLYMNGVHHQKAFLIYNGSAITAAYTGGLDVERARIQDCWCDFQCRFVGIPAEHLFSIFAGRWKEHFAIKNPIIGFDAANEKLPNVLPLTVRAGSQTCQFTSTFGNPQRPNPFAIVPGQNFEQNVNTPHRLAIDVPIPHPLSPFTSFTLAKTFKVISNAFFASRNPDGIGILLHEQNQPRMYQFAPQGHHAIYDAVKLAIGLTERFIYIEDQYLVCDQAMGKLDSMLELLKRKVGQPGFQRLVILTTRIDEINGPEAFQGTAWAHRSSFLRELHAAGPDKVAICQYKSNKQLGRGDCPNSPFYIHSKTWIFDDKLLLSGSANCNRRGYSHDSELDFAVCDRDDSWVRDTRARIWMRRLYTEGCFKPPTIAELKEVNNAAVWDRWFKPYRYTKDLESSAYTQDRGVERPSQLSDFSPIANPDRTPIELGNDVNNFLALYGIKVTVDQTIARFYWNYVVDPEGT
jgi:phosphatidylserine/phosphatidylglycerophosphate/cardiolipin synthase-like enzyme